VGGKRFCAGATTTRTGHTDAPTALPLRVIRKKKILSMALYHPSISRLDIDLAWQNKWLPPAQRSPGGICSEDGSPAALGLGFSKKLASARPIISAS